MGLTVGLWEDRRLTYIVWILPVLVAIAAITSGRLGVLTASASGLPSALVVALAAPHSFQLADAAASLARCV